MKSLITLFQAMLVLAFVLGSSVVKAYQSNGNAPSASASANLANAVMLPALPGDAGDLDNLSGATAADAQGNVAELKRMVQAGALTEMRVTYNGSYGAGLFFYPRDMVFYVALFQDKNYWRVVKTQDDAHAETVYAQFARKSYSLADGEIRRTQLLAQKVLLERVIAVSNDRALRLSADLSIAQAQESQVSQRQQQMQAESIALQNDKMAAERKLRALQNQVQQLQEQNEAGLMQ
jgi:Protein of unknown function (DUF2968)